MRMTLVLKVARSVGFAMAAAMVGCYSPVVASGGYSCTDPATSCPEGFSCVAGLCVGGQASTAAMARGDGGMSGLFQKTGLPNNSVNSKDSKLNTTADCPDQDLEPNDSSSQAITSSQLQLTITPDLPTMQIQNVAICPKGVSAKTGLHDVDYYKVDTTGAVSLVAELSYQIAYGDLDVGIFDASGTLIAHDGTALDNGCASGNVQGGGTYYVAVAGANNSDVGKYTLRIRTYSSARTCEAPIPPADMAGTNADMAAQCFASGSFCVSNSNCCNGFCDTTGSSCL